MCEVDTTLEIPFEDLLSFGAIGNRRGHLGWGLPFLFPLKTFAISIGKKVQLGPERLKDEQAGQMPAKHSYAYRQWQVWTVCITADAGHMLSSLQGEPQNRSGVVVPCFLPQFQVPTA